jgi:GNAT superfamily N-acetyltransferase
MKGDRAMEYQKDNFQISTNKERLQLDVIADYLQHNSYWAKERSLPTIVGSVEQSLCFGVYTHDLQVGFARVVTDSATFAYLCDVFILPAWQGQGLGKWLIECVVSYLDEQGVSWTMLATRDAHELYEEYGGFQKLHLPEKWMGRTNPNLTRSDPDQKVTII